ncbi:MAG: arginine repressor [Oscillospiraceae bacterium]|nr:arginine repressor [Oscillospiraceae bacterium]
MENKRQKAILEIINTYAIETQDELIEKLAECGIACAQATVSRDIKRLHLVKEPNGSGYRYVVSAQHGSFDVAERLQKVLQEYGTDVDYSSNLVVFKTIPGLGAAAGAAFDSMEIEQMVGCVSGNDTVVIIMRDEVSARDFCKELSEICGKRKG